MWEGVGDRTELQHIDLPSPSGHSRLSFPSPGLLNKGPEGPAYLGHILIPASSHQLVSKLTDFLSLPIYIIVQSPTQYHWIGTFDRHQAEITVMQFTGHSLPVHQSMSVSWAFTLSHIVSQARLRDFFPQLPSECVTSFSCITLEWHVWPGRRSKYNTSSCCINSTKWILTKRLEKSYELYLTNPGGNIQKKKK